jgi:hypothetical protein
MARTKSTDEKQRNKRIAEVTPQLIEIACEHPGVNQMFHSIQGHSGYAAAKMYIWVSWYGRGKKLPHESEYIER